MVSIVLAVIGLCVLTGVIIFCSREIKAAFYNPLPKLENGDKRIGEIRVVKTRKLVKYK